MSSKTLLILKPHLNWMTRSVVNGFHENMLWILCSLGVFVCNYVLFSVRLLFRQIFSLQVADVKNDHTVDKPHEDCQLETNNYENEGTDGFNETEAEEDVDDGISKEEEVREDYNLLERSSATIASKSQFTSSKDISGTIEEPTWMRFSFQEFYVCQNVATISDHRNSITGVVAEKDIPKLGLEEAAGDHIRDYGFDQIQTIENEQFICNDVGLEIKSTLENPSSDSGDLSFKVNSLASEDSISSEHHSLDAGAIVFEEQSLASDANSESAYLFMFTQGSHEEVSKQMDVAEELGVEEPVVDIDERKVEHEEEVPLCETIIPDIKDENFNSDDEYIELEPGVMDSRITGKHILPEPPDLYRVVCSETKIKEEQEHPVPDNDLSKPIYDEQDEFEDEWEHEDILEQLKLELGNARTGGLPTILEEANEGGEEAETSESPAPVVEVLNTLRMDRKLEYKDRVSEIQEFYKIYVEKMRKLDVLNYQTMHAIGLLQLKGPVKIISTTKSVASDSMSLMSHDIWPRKAWKNKEDPIMKFVGELHRDLELVYVGQACLSWEVLRWQHEKVQELKEYDEDLLGRHRYNVVAGEFQLFQVLLQRFIENQPFQGPRIRSYVKNRCVICSLLQVPAVRDDRMEDKNIHVTGEEEEEVDATSISSERLKEILEESMHIFWNFLKTDEFSQQSSLSSDLMRDPSLSDLLMDIQTSLQKKERRLKDITRSGNCIVKKFQKHRKSRHDHEQFLAQVQLRLLSRVLTMSKLTKDQLIWCREKLDQTSIHGKKIHVEPLFSLFPC